jgi:hypothetical protein
MRNLSWQLLLCGVVMLLVAGCRPDDPITRVVVDAEQSGVKFDEDESNGPPARMLVAIHAASDSTWTFKVSGLLELVNANEEKCLDFFRTVEFADGVPSLDALPEGWSSVAIKPGPFAPFARLQVAKDLTLSVSRLPAGFDMLGNVNRWRGQLSLSPTNRLDLAPLTGEPKTEFVMFDVTGSLGGGGGMSAPFAGGNAPRREQPAAESAIDYLAPPGWEVGRSSNIVAARLSKSEGDSLVQITVTKLPADLNRWQQVSRNWAGEVGLESLTDKEMQERTSVIEIGNLKGQGIRLIEDGETITRGLIGYRTVKDGNGWFVKMVGDKKLVAENEKDFVGFANTIRFK